MTMREGEMETRMKRLLSAVEKLEPDEACALLACALITRAKAGGTPMTTVVKELVHMWPALHVQVLGAPPSTPFKLKLVKT